MNDISPLTAVDFEQVRYLAQSSCGIHLTEGKRALVSSRLERLVRRHGFRSFGEYIRFVSARRHGAEFTEFVDTLTTNHSGFWREPEHFLFLQKNVFPARRSRIRIWSSACATGEEPHTIAMCALDAGIASCSITATDISRAALAVATAGEYDLSKLSQLPAGWPNRWLQRVKHRPESMRMVVPAVRSLVDFRPLNLLESFAHLGQFDVIFCRNVMIYFQQETRDQLVERLSEQLVEGGYLFTGHSETLLRLPRGLDYVQSATYRKR
ncbi:MAG TPA: protein-glutamate O-methyltransferase CheR [Bryobacteraceae bacterium]|jgi:chemotaxis protein methyltransferase CheR|nr:protein-glutamate O-methyltransferase CheR [Bryobacteraceae bacterium]